MSSGRCIDLLSGGVQELLVVVQRSVPFNSLLHCRKEYEHVSQTY